MAISIRTSSVGGVPATRRGSVGRLGSVAAVVAILLVAGGSHAHGPTIEIRHDAMKPTLLNLFVGSTVHFKNMVEMPGGHVVVDESGILESPPLEAPGDGWHYTFEKEGTFELFIKQHPAARARIVIVPQR